MSMLQLYGRQQERTQMSCRGEQDFVRILGAVICHKNALRKQNVGFGK